MHGDKIENRQQRPLFTEQQSEEMDITCNVIYVALPECRFDYVIYPPKKTLARKPRYCHRGINASRKRTAHIREKPLDTEVRPLWTSLIESYDQENPPFTGINFARKLTF
jgi:hypothetical protein